MPLFVSRQWSHEPSLRGETELVEGGAQGATLLADSVGLLDRCFSAETSLRVEPSVVNFFNTFGFWRLRGFFSDDIGWMGEEFDRMMSAKFGSTTGGRNFLYPQFIDNSRLLTGLLEKTRLVRLMSALLGPDFIYKGSDGNIFHSATPWHRDYLVRTRSVKLLIYFEPCDAETSAIRVIPGSHFVDDAFSSFLSAGLTWPEPPHEGGFDENEFFGRGHNPMERGANGVLPHTVVPSMPGDIIIFNENLIHCTNAATRRDRWTLGEGRRRRRQMALHFCANGIPSPAGGEPDLSEMRSLSLTEMKSFQLPHMFGPQVYNSNSGAIQSMIRPLKDLSYSPESVFNGHYTMQNDESVMFGCRLKTSLVKEKARVN